MKPKNAVSLCIVTFLLTLSLPSTAFSQESDLYGTGGRERGMGATGIAGVSGHSALYYNPAGLTRTWTFNGRVDISGIFGSPSISSSSSTFNKDAEDEIGASAFLGIGLASPISMDECPKCQKDNAMIAHTCPICGTELKAAKESVWYDSLYWGMWLEFPATSGTGVEISSNQMLPEWAQYGRSSNRLAAAVGVAYRITDWISAGVSANLVYLSNGKITNRIVTFPDNSGNPNNFSNINIDQGVEFSGSVNLGFLFSPMENLDVGLAFRSERAGQTNSDSSTDLTSSVGFNTTTTFEIRSTPVFSPTQIGLGIHWDITESWAVAFDLVWMNWSAYEGPYSFLTAAGAGVASMPHTDADYRDIVVPRIGAEYVINETWQIRGGYSYRPSPAPEQDGLMNIIDSSSHMFSFGGSYKINETLSLDGFFQVHFFEEQSTTEDLSKFPPMLPGTTFTPDPESWSASATFILLGFSFNFVL